MNNDAIERDDALEDTTKTPRPVDPDKPCQISVFVTERVKRALMTAGAARRMSLGRYAGQLLAKTAGSPLNAPPEKSVTAAQEGADGMTDKEAELRAEVDRLKAEVQQQKEIAYEYVDQHTEDLKEISALRKRCQELEAEQTPIAGTTANSDESGLVGMLFFAAELMNGTGDDDGRDYYDALIGALGLTEKYIKWKDERK